MTLDYEAIVVGSGFGGAVTACRLAEAGVQVAVLERGRRYGMGDFPRRLSELRDSFWDPADGKYGLYDLQQFRNIDVLTSAGLGGGSLIYANVSLPMPEEWLDESWPGDISYAELSARYEQVQDMTEVAQYPIDRDPYRGTPKTVAHETATTAAGGEFFYPSLAVNFNGPPGQMAPNKHGAMQTSCTLVGECDFGCNVHAKNTLDLNYLFVAQKHGADIRTDHHVTAIRSVEDGYEVAGERLEQGEWEPFTLRSRYVVVAAGTLGSTRLLLRYQRDAGRALSPMLGHRFSGNGDFLSYVLGTRQRDEPTLGPVITSAGKFAGDDASGGFFVEDAGLPIFLAYYLEGSFQAATVPKRLAKAIFPYLFRYGLLKLGLLKERNTGDDVAKILSAFKTTENLHLLLGMGRDVPDGVMSLEDDGTLELDWELKSSRPYFDRMVQVMGDMGRGLGGKTQENPMWAWPFRKVVTVHPLGGCAMGEGPETGVVDSMGQVFGEDGLYVADGAIVPSPIGANPSLTIAALAERIAEGLAARVQSER